MRPLVSSHARFTIRLPAPPPRRGAFATGTFNGNSLRGRPGPRLFGLTPPFYDYVANESKMNIRKF